MPVEYVRYILPTIILSSGCFTDIRSRRVPNKLVLVLFVMTLSTILIAYGFHEILVGLSGLSAAIVLNLPLFLLKIVGGGDLKLMAVFGLATNWDTTVNVTLFGLIWGLLLGLVSIVTNKNLKVFFQNLNLMTRTKSVDGVQPHSIPFTIALFLGWVTHATMTYYGVTLW